MPDSPVERNARQYAQIEILEQRTFLSSVAVVQQSAPATVAGAAVRRASVRTARRYRAPSAPTNLAATVQSSSRILLGWTDTASTEAGFIVERSGSTSGPWATLATLPANATAYLDRRHYQTGIEPTPEQLQGLRLRLGEILPKWNYTISPVP